MAGVPRNTLPGLLADPPRGRGLLDRAGEWWENSTFFRPAYESAVSGATLPGDVWRGGVAPEQIIDRSTDMAGIAMTGGLVAPAAGPSLMSGLSRRARNVDELRSVIAQENPLANNFISETFNGTVVVSKVVVPKAERGRGLGTKFMMDVLDYADAQGKPVALTPDAAFGGNKKRLVQWYKSLGFVENKGRNRDFSISESMYRPPRLGSSQDANRL